MIYLQIQYDLLKWIAVNAEARVNRHEKKMDFNNTEVMLELSGQKDTYYYGLRNELNKSIKATELTDLSFDKFCLPCGKKNKVIHKAM